jgi:flagellin
MPLNSVNTNYGATVALESLTATQSSLSTVQNQVSTGYRVASAFDDGAAFAVAQRVRSDVNALTTANQQLGTVQGLLSTTNSALTNVSNTLSSARDVLVNLASSSVTGTQRTQYVQQYNSLVANIKTFFQDATYNGKTLVGNIGGASGFGAVNVIRNENAATYGISTFSGSAFVASISFTSTQLNGAATVAGLIGTAATATFINKTTSLGTALNTYGAANTYVNNQVSYNSNKIDALNTGLGALVDANLAQESAQLQALQIKQQLGTQALSIANQAPQSLLSLFK